MQGFQERLKILIGEHRSANSFAKEAGIGQSLLRKYLAGGTPGLDKVVQIAKATGVSINWLATGEERSDSLPPMVQSMSGTQPEQGSPPMLQVMDRKALEEGAFVLLPRYEVQASAGHGLVVEEEELRDFIALDPTYLRAAGIDPRQAHIIKVKGRSMMPTLVDGEWVIVDLTKTRIVNSDVYAVLYQGELRIKRLRSERGGAVTLVSDNANEGYPEERIEGPDLEDFRVVGRVGRHLRSL